MYKYFGFFTKQIFDFVCFCMYVSKMVCNGINFQTTFYTKTN